MLEYLFFDEFTFTSRGCGSGPPPPPSRRGGRGLADGRRVHRGRAVDARTGSQQGLRRLRVHRELEARRLDVAAIPTDDRMPRVALS